MITDAFGFIVDGIGFGTNTLLSIVENCGITRPVFVSLICGFLALNIILGTFRTRAFGFLSDGVESFSEPEENTRFAMDVERSRYRSSVSASARPAPSMKRTKYYSKGGKTL